ncbi:MAG: 3-hydroxyacyl-CoA dehydrogenase family protein [Deltaproteobacteria bacterium]|nr:3-hydroxyacyl-CoA dehydrogenase family protein [Deltaproteobacteria bacterium]
MVDRIGKIAVLGTGVIGAGWVTLFAVKGYRVTAQSRRAETRKQGLEITQSNLNFLAEKGVISEETKRASLESIRMVEQLSEAVQDADFVVESVADTYEIKKPLFVEMDKYSPAHAILASSSSGLSPTELQEGVTNQDKCIIAHPWNPPHLIPLVEVVPGEKTSQDTVDKTMALMEDLGKVPVIVNKVVPGYIGNRLAVAVWREAIDLVVNGVASVEDVDKALYAGPGIRWAFMGANLIYHLGGGETGGIGHFIDGIGNTTFSSIWREMATWDRIDDSMKERLIEGVKEEMKGKPFKEVAKWRDDKLIDLAKVIYGK